MRETREACESAHAQEHARVREKAQRIWCISKPVDLHPYLTHKKVKAFGIRQYRGSNVAVALVIPLRDTRGDLHSLQFIDAKGNKRFLSGGAITGHYYAIGKYAGTLCIAEGYATAATIHQATGHAVAVAFNAGNLKPVALALRVKFPEARIIVCADNDRFTPGNPGVTKAREAALEVKGYLVVPRFEDIGPYDHYREGGDHG
jgi:putative DNA primase/helicase